MDDYAASLRDVGAHVVAEHGGRFAAAVEAAAESAPALAGLLSQWDAFADVSTYEERPVPFFKRAQLVPADLAPAPAAPPTEPDGQGVRPQRWCG